MTLSCSCRLFGISRQAIYKQEKVYKERTVVLSQVKAMVRSRRMDMPRLGTRKLYFLLKEQFHSQRIKIGRDRLFDFLRNEHMLIKPKKSYTKTTWSKHWLRKHPNLIKDVNPTLPEQLWVSDITYLKTRKDNCYLSLVTDAFSRRIMGYHLSDDLKADSVVKALKMAVADRVYSHELIHHSDRGLQYCSEPYQLILHVNNIRCSMTDGYDCYQNALAERMNGILKEEFLFPVVENMEQLKIMVKQSIDIYNSKRPHLSLDMKTPDQVHKQNPQLIKNQGLIYSF